jgi:hypothetical protein
MRRPSGYSALHGFSCNAVTAIRKVVRKSETHMCRSAARPVTISESE